MLFNSIDFAIFLPIFFLLYWFVTQRKLGAQNLLVVLASYLFYGWWDWRFLSLIVFSTLVDYFIGLNIQKSGSENLRRRLLIVSLVVNLGFLGFFKYYNFFAENFIEAFSFLGYQMSLSSLNIVLPVGISFYTFQTMSYTIDVYRRKLEASRDIVAFAAFVSFFPQLVAGPIERATNLLPQFYKSRVFNKTDAVIGMRQILWGLFKKVVIADNCAIYANEIFNNYTEYNGVTLFLGGVFFALQIYGDFSGYSDIAIGTARLFGFKLMQNFNFPYFSRDIAEFWRRWHISLSTWFRDYLYIPLGGSRVGTLVKVRNTFVIFLVSGFWHGANWTFIFWGALNAIYFLPLLLLQKNRTNVGLIAEGRLFPSIKELLSISATFFITVIAWIFFRSESLGQAFEIINNVFSTSFFSRPVTEGLYNFKATILLILGFVIFEWIGRNEKFALQAIGKVNRRFLRWFCYALVIYFIGTFMPTVEVPFIYFQF